MMPPKRKTPMHSFPCDNEDWQAAKTNADERGEVWSKRLQAFVKREAKRPPTADGAQR